jgi:hypothetical protein
VSLTLAILFPGILLTLIGVSLLYAQQITLATLKAFPRSKSATLVFFGSASLWFLYNIWHLSSADFGDYRNVLVVGFAAIALFAFKSVPDFLAVRGLCILILLAAMPLLMAGYMNYEHPLIYFQKGFLYVCISLALWLGAQPYRLRDFVEFITHKKSRAGVLGGISLAYGLLLIVVSFTY